MSADAGRTNGRREAARFQFPRPVIVIPKLEDFRPEIPDLSVLVARVWKETRVCINAETIVASRFVLVARLAVSRTQRRSTSITNSQYATRVNIYEIHAVRRQCSQRSSRRIMQHIADEHVDVECRSTAQQPTTSPSPASLGPVSRDFCSSRETQADLTHLSNTHIFNMHRFNAVPLYRAGV